MSARFAAKAVAFLGASIFYALVLSQLPETPFGRALGATVLWVSLHPLARLTWLSERYEWRYWVGGAALLPIVLTLEQVGRDLPSVVKEAITALILITSIVMMIVTQRRRGKKKIAT